jgi:long-chain acyl-CoA synthetase
MGVDKETQARIALFSTPPPPNAPYAVPVPGSAVENRSPVYRHWRCQDGLIETWDPKLRTLHDLFVDAATRFPNNKCLGHRPWNPTTKTWGNKYVWQTYAEVAERSKNFGVGVLELHRQAGVTADKFPVGMWLQNRPEWQISGKALRSAPIQSA